MEKVLWLKFNQHPRLADVLLATGDAELVEVSLFSGPFRSKRSHLTM